MSLAVHQLGVRRGSDLAIEAVMAGASWTEAAHEAGFADSAHLTRTHRRMFGIEPSAVRPLPVDRADA